MVKWLTQRVSSRMRFGLRKSELSGLSLSLDVED